MFWHAYHWKNISEWRKAIIQKAYGSAFANCSIISALKKVNVKYCCKLYWNRNTEKELHLWAWPRRSSQVCHKGDLLRKARECSRLPSRVQSKHPYHLPQRLHCEGPSIPGEVDSESLCRGQQQQLHHQCSCSGNLPPAFRHLRLSSIAFELVVICVWNSSQLYNKQGLVDFKKWDSFFFLLNKTSLLYIA